MSKKADKIVSMIDFAVVSRRLLAQDLSDKEQLKVRERVELLRATEKDVMQSHTAEFLQEVMVNQPSARANIFMKASTVRRWAGEVSAIAYDGLSARFQKKMARIRNKALAECPARAASETRVLKAPEV